MSENQVQNQEKQQKEQTKESRKLSIENIVGIVLIAVFLPVIIFNMIIVIKGYTDPNNVPTVAGIAPLVVGSDSMSKHPEADNGGAFNKGDIIVIKKVDASSLEEKDIITYIYQNDIITHRIVEVYNINEKYTASKTAYEEAKAAYEALPSTDPGKEAAKDAMDEAEKLYNFYYQDYKVAEEYGCTLVYVTKGDFQSPAEIRIYDHQLQGKYLFRIPYVGKVIEFFQKPLGIIVLVCIPVAVYFGFEMFKKARQSKNSEQKIAELEAKLAKQEENDAE